MAAGAGTAMIEAEPQTPPRDPAKADTLQTIPVRIDVMLTRLQGEKKISTCRSVCSPTRPTAGHATNPSASGWASMCRSERQR